MAEACDELCDDATGITCEDTSWISELEQELLVGSDLNVVRAICNGRPVPQNLRVDFWKVCLHVEDKNDAATLDEIYDLPEQSVIREDSRSLVERLGNDEEDKVSVTSDLESVLTKHSKATGLPYSKDCGWLEILEPLLALRLPSSQLYSVFHSIQRRYIPSHLHKNGHPFHLFRLLVLYHDPQLCSFLDTKKINPDCFAQTWFRSLFSATWSLEVTHLVWDTYFQLEDPFFIFFFALVFLVNARDKILDEKEEPRQAIIEFLKAVPCGLKAEDIADFLTVAQHYMVCTPTSFKTDHFPLIFQPEDDATKDTDLCQALCLPVSVEELILSCKPDESRVNDVRYFLVDCRPAEQYNSGHLPTAFHLDASLMLQEPDAFRTAVQGLLAAKDQALAAESVAAGEHLCFMGSGREDEDQYVHMVVASFLQQHHKYVSLVTGGYSALHKYLSEDLATGLADHNPRACIACLPAYKLNGAIGSPDDDDASFLDKVAVFVRSNATVVRERLFDYITNPQAPPERHVNSNDKLGRRYRSSAPIFSIDDDHEVDEVQDDVGLQVWLKKPDVIGYFKCDEITENGYLFPSYLALTGTHLYILREFPNKKGFGRIVARRPLVSIIKITSKKRRPELITFKYGHSDGADNFTFTAMDRLVIPKAGEATQLIKSHVVKLLESEDAR